MFPSNDHQCYMHRTGHQSRDIRDRKNIYLDLESHAESKRESNRKEIDLIRHDQYFIPGNGTLKCKRSEFPLAKEQPTKPLSN